MFGIPTLSQNASPGRQRGFTLIETIVTLAIISVVAALSFGVIGLQRSARFDSQSQELLGALREMQSKARSVEGNQEYGVSFSGNSYSTYSRNPGSGVQTLIKTTALSSTLTTAITPNAAQITFNRLTGVPANGTSATLTMDLTNPTKQRVIKVETNGAIYVQ